MKRKFIFAVLFIIFIGIAYAGQIVPAKFQAFDSTGAPLSGGYLYTYIAGTSTNKATYSDAALTTANSNPVLLDARGEASIFGAGIYKFILKDSDGTTIWTMDNIAVMGLTYIQDADADSRIDVEENADEDIVRITTGGTERITIQAGKVEPSTDDDMDLGSGLKLFRNIYAEMFLGYVQRAQFAYVDGDQISLSHGVYDVNGKIARISGTITTVADTFTGHDFYYLYIDYSEIPATGVIDNSDLYWDNTEPDAYGATKKGMYHGTATDDRCIFAVYVVIGTDDIQRFLQSGESVRFANANIIAGQAAEFDADFTNIVNPDDYDAAYLPIPSFCTSAQVVFEGGSSDIVSQSTLYTSPSSTTVIRSAVGTVKQTADYRYDFVNQVRAHTGTDQVLYVWWDSADTDLKSSVYVAGWYFPTGM